ncbi:MAG: hypothetical protein PHX83_06620 [Acidobacteriia bacterium]|nr:hypothetical protein [Terriglobia bacterium]
MSKLVDLVGKVKTSAQAKRVCLALAKHYGATIQYGPTSATVKTLAAALDAIGVKDRETFLYNCAITVGDVIYLPFKLGPSAWTPAQQVCIVAHECQHVKQGGDAHLLFWLRYFTSKAHMAVFEVAALSAEMEVYWRLTGYLFDAKNLAASLSWYGVGKKDIAVCAKHLAIVENTLQRGGEVCDQIKVIAKALA